jgi:putative hydrolase
MIVLEGHAEYVIDGVGPAVVPSVETIRTAVTARRGGRGGLDALLRRLLGLEAKMRQYRDGERFVAGAVQAVGMAGFNRIWDDPKNLPTTAELHDPKAWVQRVHPERARSEVSAGERRTAGNWSGGSRSGRGGDA